VHRVRVSFENLRVYQAAQELRAEVDKLRPLLVPRFQGLFAHVDDAVDSIMNNIAEGSGTMHPGKAANFFDIAEGSSREARSGLRSLDRRRAFGGASVFRPIVLTLSISKMLRAMIAKLQNRIRD
jgi:four helix bundle protein